MELCGALQRAVRLPRACFGVIVQHGEGGHFCSMVMGGLASSESTLSSVLNGCTRPRDSRGGSVLHGWVVKSEELDPDTPPQNALLGMYAAAVIWTPNLVSLDTLIAGFCGTTDGWSAMEAFVRLKDARFGKPVAPYEYTFVAMVSAALPAMRGGMPLHAEVVKAGLETSVFLSNTLINMYFTNWDPGSA
uniref:Uncharacterized protein n=2 Tax=Aegilops tauschii TaxID=37682 RepID=A0A453DFA2_AEGTS